MTKKPDLDTLDLPVSSETLFGLRTPDVLNRLRLATARITAKADIVRGNTGEGAGRVLPIDVLDSAVTGGLRTYLSQDEGQGYWDFIEIWQGVYLAVGDAHYKKTTHIEVPAEQLLQLRIVCSGSMAFPEHHLALTQGSTWVQLLGGHSSLKYVIDHSRPLRAIVIDIRVEALPGLGINTDMLPECFGPRVEQETPLNPYFMISANEKLLHLANEIIASRQHLEHGLRLMFVRGKTMELICEVFSGSKLRSAQGTGSAAQKRSIPWLHEASEILANDLEHPVTIDELARLVGISKTKLKNRFRDYLGKSIHQYQTDIRMQQASRLLKETELQVADIGRQIGFKHPASFTHAIKKYFGVRPLELRNQLRQ